MRRWRVVQARVGEKVGKGTDDEEGSEWETPTLPVSAAAVNSIKSSHRVSRSITTFFLLAYSKNIIEPDTTL